MAYHKTKEIMRAKYVLPNLQLLSFSSGQLVALYYFHMQVMCYENRFILGIARSTLKSIKQPPLYNSYNIHELIERLLTAIEQAAITVKLFIIRETEALLALHLPRAKLFDNDSSPFSRLARGVCDYSAP